MELEHVFTYHAMLRPPVQYGGPFGGRTFFEATGGAVDGPRLKGKVTTGGGDWALIGADGFARLDVRAGIETDDGASIYIAYFGMLEVNETVQQAMAAGAETQFADQYFRTTPRFETSDERYLWLTRSVFVGEGRLYPGLAVEYRVHRVT